MRADGASARRALPLQLQSRLDALLAEVMAARRDDRRFEFVEADGTAQVLRARATSSSGRHPQAYFCYNPLRFLR